MGKKKEKKVEIVDYSSKPIPMPKGRLVGTILLIFLVLAAFSFGIYLLFGVLENPENGGEEAGEVKAVIDQGRELLAWENEEFLLSAEGSTGPIESYKWELDGTQVSGKSISHRFSTAGKYTVGLRVFNAQGNSSRTWIMVRVNYRDEGIQGTTSSPSSSSMTYTKTFSVVGQDGASTLASSININVEYPVGSTPDNRLNLTVKDGNGTSVNNGIYEIYNESGNSMINWTLSPHQWIVLYTPGTWTLTITQESPTMQPRTVEFTIDIYVIY